MDIKQEWFHNKSSYEAFMYAAALVDQINQAKSKGAIIYDDGSEVKGDFKVILNPDSPRIGVSVANCFCGYVGYCCDSKTGKTYCTKKKVKESFKNVSWVFPKDFHKLV